MPQRLAFRDLVFSVDEWEFKITYRDYMIVRFGFLVAASIAAYAVSKINTRTSKSTSSIKPAANGEANNYLNGRIDENRVSISNDIFGENNENEEEEKVKLIGWVTNPALSNPREIEDEEILTKFVELLTRERDSTVSNDELYWETKSYAEKARVDEIEMGKNANELERLRTLVNELEEKEEKLQGELLELYCLKEQESNVAGLQKELRMKVVEIDVLNKTINTLQAERRKLQEEVSHGDSARNELEAARNKLKEFQRQLQLEANQTKGQLLLLKQQVSSLQAKEEEAIKNNVEVEMKLKAVMELEVEVLELNRRNKELQHEKRELALKLDAAEARISALSTTTESEMVAKAREVKNLKHATEDILKQVQRLQKNRFGEVEELVNLRWVNACMRFELKNHPTPAGKTSSTRVLNKNLSPKSREKAKQMVLEYDGETDGESNSSHPSSSGSEDLDNTSIHGSTSKNSCVDKKQSLIQKLKKWGKCQDESSTISSSSRSLSGVAPSHISISHRRTNSLEALVLRDAGDGMSIMTFGKMEEDQGPPRSLKAPSLPFIGTHDSSGDSPLNAVLASFQLMLNSVEEIVDDTYLVCKDRHKLALEREKQIKLRAEQARAEKFANNLCLHSTYETRVTTEKGKKLRWFPLKHSQIRETVADIGDPGDKSNNAKTTGIPMMSKIKHAGTMKRPPRVLCPLLNHGEVLLALQILVL